MNALEQELLSTILKKEFRKIGKIKIEWITYGQYLRWCKGYSNKESFIAQAGFEKKTIYFHAKYKKSLYQHPGLLKEIIRHECLHFHAGVGHHGKFAKQAHKRNIHYLPEIMKNTIKTLKSGK